MGVCKPAAGMRASTSKCREAPPDYYSSYVKGRCFCDQLHQTTDELQLLREVVPFEVNVTANSWAVPSHFDNLLQIKHVMNKPCMKNLGSTVFRDELLIYP